MKGDTERGGATTRKGPALCPRGAMGPLQLRDEGGHTPGGSALLLFLECRAAVSSSPRQSSIVLRPPTATSAPFSKIFFTSWEV